MSRWGENDSYMSFLGQFLDSAYHYSSSGGSINAMQNFMVVSKPLISLGSLGSLGSLDFMQAWV